MKNDPDIIRWSQLKRFVRNTLGWMAVYGIFGWLGDVTRYSDQSNLTHFFLLVALSVFMTLVTWKN